MTLTALGILVWSAIISYISIRNSFFGLKLLAGMSWFVFFMYIKDNPPASVLEGSPVHVGIMVVSIGFGLMLVLAGLSKGVKTNNSISINGKMQSVETEGFHLPDWMKNMTANDLSPEEKKSKLDQSLYDYRMQLRNAYTGSKKKVR